jgi:HlyD family secretion protein
VHTDFNRSVVSGQLLAEIDPSLIEAQLAQLEANLQELQAQLGLAQRRLARSENLVARGFISSAQLDDDRQAQESLQARVRAIEAQIKRERTNLEYTQILSPIDGIVIARSVDVGQTVAASFQTPTLFMIARDLRDMQIDTNVAEADVGALREGMTARFTLDALGERSFEARVRQVRLNPKIEQNVVTYNVVLATRNDDGRLLPGMTASVRIRVAAKTDVLRVPNTALRFRPSDPQRVEQRDASPAEAAAGTAPARPPARGIRRGRTAGARPRCGDAGDHRRGIHRDRRRRIGEGGRPGSDRRTDPGGAHGLERRLVHAAAVLSDPCRPRSVPKPGRRWPATRCAQRWRCSAWWWGWPRSW